MFEQERFKRNFILMNQKSRQNAKNSTEKDFFKLMNNANFRYDCRNNLDKCQFIPIFEEMNEVNSKDTIIILIKKFRNL